jgi:hypothetical protein
MRLSTGSVYLALVMLGIVGCGGGGGAGATTPVALPSVAAPSTAPLSSRIQSVTVTGRSSVGTFNGASYSQIVGTVAGSIDLREPIVGLTAQPGETSGQFSYTAQFEMIAPDAGSTANSLVYVDAENRGSAVSIGTLNGISVGGAPSTKAYYLGLGNGFLQNSGISYARVQWQTGIAAGVPASAQGVGLVIVRDFARYLAGRTPQTVTSGGTLPPPYRTLVLGGISQSAWFVDDFMAEGFNVDPTSAKGVFDGAIAIDGVGDWLALNNLEAQLSGTESPYLDPRETPLLPAQMLSRPATDPDFVDVANYTDFYRVFAGLSDTGYSSPRYHRYDWPSPHAVGAISATAAAVPGCNDGIPVVLNPIGYVPYFRAILVGLAHDLGVPAAASALALPANATFTLTPSTSAMQNINLLNGQNVPIPVVDGNQMPVGGVRFPDAVDPLGEPGPVSLAPVVTNSIDATCGNFGVFTPYTGAQLSVRYGSKANYLALYDTQIQSLIAAGYLLSSDEAGMLTRAGTMYDTFAAQ